MSDVLLQIEEGALPLYYQIIRIVERKIVEGSLRAGDQLPTEQELCDQYKVSRTTVRQALLQLVNDGVLYRKQGKGTFVAKPKLLRSITNLYSFSASMEEIGVVPSSRVMEQNRVSAPHNVIDKLELGDSNNDVIRITRLRLANGDPLMIETSYVPYRLAPRLVEEDLAHGSLYSILSSSYRLHVTDAEETYESIVLKAEEAELLQCTPFSPGFFIERLAFLEAGIPVEYSNSVVCASRCKLVTRLRNKRATFERKIIPSSKPFFSHENRQ
ncbi:MAG: GntR family transcriptional regulator [Spirochaetia bacterium]|jgi:GntR family transcriptional regulator